MNFKHSPSGLIQHISYLGDILKKHNWKKRKDDLCVLVELYDLYEVILKFQEIDFGKNFHNIV